MVMANATTGKNEGVEGTNETSNAVMADEDGPGYLEGWPLIWLAIGLMFSSFLLAIDNTVLATAIPQITSDFNSLSDMGWYGASYLIAQMAMLPTCGRIYTFYNIKWTFIGLLFIFEIGSIISAAAPNSMTFIIGRAVSGLGGAGLLSGATVIISYTVELKKRAMLLAILFSLYGAGSVAGPLIGGVITDNKTLTWRFIFWMNLPIGAVGMGLIYFTLKKPPPPAAEAGLSSMKKIRQLDIPGAALLIGSITCLLLALQWGGIEYAWSNPRVFGCLIGFGVVLIAFLVLQFRDKENATIPLKIFRNRTVCAACGFILFLQTAVVAQTYYWPIYFQSVRNSSARDSGIYMLPMIISTSLSTLVVGWLISKIGTYVPFMWLGAPTLAVGGGLYQLLDVDSPVSHWIGFQIVSGVGCGICTQIPIMSVQVVLDKADVPIGCVMVIFFQALGGVIATSIGQNIFTDQLVKELTKVDGVDAHAVVTAGAKDFRKIIPPHMLDDVIQAFAYALKSVFYLAVATAAVALIISLAMEWRKLPQDRKEEDSASDATPSPPV